MISHRYRPALYLQLTHIILSIVWNIAGLYLLRRGLQALGPTASLQTILILVLLAGLLVLSANKWGNWVYLGVSLILLFGSLSAIYGGFTNPSSLWPSEFWRYAGVLVNCIGLAGFLLAVKTAINPNRT